MILVLILTWILETAGDPTALALWQWFGSHMLLTVLMLVVFA